MNDGRGSGELEGSTLGSSSREGDRKAPFHRMTHSSSSFLLDSSILPRSKTSRITSHRSRPSEPPTDKRTAHDPDIVVPKRRSRFPWAHRKSSASDSTAAPATWAPGTTQTPTPPEAQPRRSLTQGETRADHEALGLDTDSIQIVNLALNLNESRRRAASGLPPGSAGRRSISVSQPSPPVAKSYTSSPGEQNRQRSSSYRSYVQAPSNNLSQVTQPGVDQHSPVLDLLPATAADDQRAYEFSNSTLARAEKARRHFELSHEYLRLLPSLPPLRNPLINLDLEHSRTPNSSSLSNRVYNPLQMIRNRRIRYREKCPIDTEAEGWHDVGKVHEWVSAVQETYRQSAYDSLQSVKLPPFQDDQRLRSREAPDDLETVAVSPPSSLRHVSRSSIKAPRPRLDWDFSPADLLADAAWVEDGANKTKIVDKDGNKLYADPPELIHTDPRTDLMATRKQRTSVERDPRADKPHSSPHASFSGSHPALAQEFKSVGRGRQTNQVPSRLQALHNRSLSSEQVSARRSKGRVRSSSLSSDASAQIRSAVDQSRRASREDALMDNETWSRKQDAKSLVSRTSQMKPTQTCPSAPPIDTQKGNRAWHHHRRSSPSSAGSLEDHYNPRMSLEGMDSTAPSSPHAGYFPSIAANLSTPSSRSPSPPKKGFRHKIVSRHDRSKSKQLDRESQGRVNDRLTSETLRPQKLPFPPERDESAPKLEPSPLPDVVSSSYPDNPELIEGHRGDASKTRRGPDPSDAKLRGIFKGRGRGRIAEIVGNEVSKVGGFITKKDSAPPSRRSSSATTFDSDDSNIEEEARPDKLSGPKGLLRRLPILADEPGVRKDSEKGTSRSFIPSLPTFTRQDGRSATADVTEFGSPRERVSASRRHDLYKRPGLQRSKTIGLGPGLHIGKDRVKHNIKDPSEPFSLTRPPVTGLANARASLETSQEKRPSLSSTTSAWRLSDRSLRTLNDYGVPEKQEVERTRALLLSSGIKAREISRRAHTVPDRSLHWLHSPSGPGATSVPRVTRLGEFDLAAQNCLRRFENTQYSFQQSMHHFSTATSSPLRAQIKGLETLVNQSLTPRVRAVSNDAEDLCLQLNTTSTLAIKQLSDALDKGVRKRRRRLRWFRRTGFVVLEWALVGMLWWVWLIVMAFKLVRGIFRGAISGVRWMLWL